MQILPSNGSKAPETVVSPRAPSPRQLATRRRCSSMLSVSQLLFSLAFCEHFDVGQLRQAYLHGTTGRQHRFRDTGCSNNIRRHGLQPHPQLQRSEVRHGFGVGAVIWRSPLNCHIPCNCTPPKLSLKLTKFTSNILAIYIRKQKLGPLTPRQNLRGFCLFVRDPEARAGTCALVDSYQ